MKKLTGLFIIFILLGSSFPVNALPESLSLNKITSLGILGSVSNFFKNLFGRGKRGIIIGQDEKYEELKPQCPDPKCLVNTDQGYQCLNSGDGFFNFKEGTSNVCLAGNLESYNEELCISNIKCKETPKEVDSCLYYHDRKYILAFPIYNDYIYQLAKQTIPLEGIHYLTMANDPRWGAALPENFMNSLKSIPSEDVCDRSNGRITFNHCLSLDKIPDKKVYIDFRAGNNFGSDSGICQETEVVRICGNPVDKIQSTTGIFETPVRFSTTSKGYQNIIDAPQTTCVEDTTFTYNQEDYDIFTKPENYAGNPALTTKSRGENIEINNPVCEYYTNGDDCRQNAFGGCCWTVTENVEDGVCRSGQDNGNGFCTGEYSTQNGETCTSINIRSTCLTNGCNWNGISCQDQGATQPEDIPAAKKPVEETAPVQEEDACSINTERLPCLNDGCDWTGDACVSVTGFTVAPLSGYAIYDGILKGLKDFLNNLFGRGTRGAAITTCSHPDRQTCEENLNCFWNNGCFPFEEETPTQPEEPLPEPVTPEPEPTPQEPNQREQPQQNETSSSEETSPQEDQPKPPEESTVQQEEAPIESCSQLTDQINCETNTQLTCQWIAPNCLEIVEQVLEKDTKSQEPNQREQPQQNETSSSEETSPQEDQPKPPEESTVQQEEAPIESCSQLTDQINCETNTQLTCQWIAPNCLEIVKQVLEKDTKPEEQEVIPKEPLDEQIQEPEPTIQLQNETLEVEQPEEPTIQPQVEPITSQPSKKQQQKRQERSETQGTPLAVYNHIEASNDLLTISLPTLVRSHHIIKITPPHAYKKGQKPPTNVQVQWALANDLLAEPFEDEFIAYKKFYDVGKGIFSLQEPIEHKGNAFCSFYGAKESDHCLLNNRNYIYRARFLDENNVPLSNWMYKQRIFTATEYAPNLYIERLKQVEIDQFGCNEFKWETPGIETKIIEPFGLANIIKFRSSAFKTDEVVNFRVEYNDGTSWYDVGVIRSDNPNFIVKTDVYEPHDKNAIYDDTVETKYNKGGRKLKLKEWQIPHVGFKDCKIDGKKYGACLDQGNYVYRVRAEDPETGYPLSDYYISDYVRLDYKYWYLINDDNKDAISKIEGVDPYTELDDVIRNQLLKSYKLNSDDQKIKDKRMFLFHGRKYKFDDQGIVREGCSNLGVAFKSVYKTVSYAALATALAVPGLNGVSAMAMMTLSGNAASGLGSKFGNTICGSKCAFAFSQIAAIATSAGAANAGGSENFLKRFGESAARSAITQSVSYGAGKLCEGSGGNKAACGLAGSALGSFASYKAFPPGGGNIKTFGQRLCRSDSALGTVCDSILRGGYSKLNAQFCKGIGVDSPEGLQTCELVGQLAYDVAQEKTGRKRFPVEEIIAELKGLRKELSEEELQEKRAKIAVSLQALREGEYVVPDEVLLAWARIIDPESFKVGVTPGGLYLNRNFLDSGVKINAFYQILTSIGYTDNDVERFIKYFKKGNIVFPEDNLAENNFFDVLSHERLHKFIEDGITDEQLTALNEARDYIIDDYLTKKEQMEEEYNAILLDSNLNTLERINEIKELLNRYGVILRDEYGADFNNYVNVVTDTPLEFYPYLFNGKINKNVLLYIKENFPDAYNLFMQLSKGAEVEMGDPVLKEKVRDYYDETSGPKEEETPIPESTPNGGGEILGHLDNIQEGLQEIERRKTELELSEQNADNLAEYALLSYQEEELLSELRNLVGYAQNSNQFAGVLLGSGAFKSLTAGNLESEIDIRTHELFNLGHEYLEKKLGKGLITSKEFNNEIAQLNIEFEALQTKLQEKSDSKLDLEKLLSRIGYKINIKELDINLIDETISQSLYNSQKSQEAKDFIEAYQEITSRESPLGIPDSSTKTSPVDQTTVDRVKKLLRLRNELSRAEEELNNMQRGTAQFNKVYDRRQNLQTEIERVEGLFYLPVFNIDEDKIKSTTIFFDITNPRNGKNLLNREYLSKTAIRLYQQGLKVIVGMGFHSYEYEKSPKDSTRSEVGSLFTSISSGRGTQEIFRDIKRITKDKPSSHNFKIFLTDTTLEDLQFNIDYLDDVAGNRKQNMEFYVPNRDNKNYDNIIQQLTNAGWKVNKILPPP